MKKKISLLLLVLMMLSVIMFGCKNSNSLNDYVVNADGIVNIGVLLPLSGDFDNIGEKITDGLKYANELAPGVKMNKEGKHLINLIYKDIEGEYEEACKEFKDNNVAAVICAGTDKDKTDSIISEFKNESTALVFLDSYSSNLLSSSNSLSLSIPYNYQTSVAATYFSEQGLQSGAIVVPDDDYGKSFARMFKDTILASGGESVSEYYYGTDEGNFNAKTIVGAGIEFVFIVGNQENAKELYLELKETDTDMPIMLSEVLDKGYFEEEEYNNLVYISKFEEDENNYIGTDFIKSYSQNMNISKSDITSSTAYGYDAYMIIYGALMSFNSSSFTSDKSNNDSDSADVYASQVLSALKTSAHMGVTDSIAFANNGTVDTNFLYIGTIQNGNSVMLNRYNYNHETD